MSFMYAHGFWIRSHHGEQLGKLLLGFLQAYASCARVCLREQRNRFALIPKLHMVHHTALRLMIDSGRADWVISPLATSAQQQEDFIGKPARLSRRVAAGRLLHTRLMERSLICSMHAIKAADQDDRGF